MLSLHLLCPIISLHLPFYSFVEGWLDHPAGVEQLELQVSALGRWVWWSHQMQELVTGCELFSWEGCQASLPEQCGVPGTHASSSRHMRLYLAFSRNVWTGWQCYGIQVENISQSSLLINRHLNIFDRSTQMSVKLQEESTETLKSYLGIQESMGPWDSKLPALPTSWRHIPVGSPGQTNTRHKF